MADGIEEVVNRTEASIGKVIRSVDEIPQILQDYLEKGTAGLITFLSTYLDEEGIGSYRWLSYKISIERRTKYKYKWLHSLFPAEENEVHLLIDKVEEKEEAYLASKSSMPKSRHNVPPEPVGVLIKMLIANNGNISLTAKELGYADHTTLGLRLDSIYEEHPLIAEIVYDSVGKTSKLPVSLMRIHYRVLDEGLEMVATGKLTMAELAREMGYSSDSGLHMLIKRRPSAA